MKRTAAVLAVLPVLMLAAARAAPVSLLVEAESFQIAGDWRVGSDRDALGGALMQVVPPVRSPGVKPTPPVDALTAIDVAATAEYRVWVRTRDYATYPGTRRFAVTIDGASPFPEAGNLGREGWGWQKLGSLRLDAGRHLLGLRDTARSYGRCDAVLLAVGDLDPSRTPPAHLARFRIQPARMPTDREAAFAPPPPAHAVTGVVAALDNGVVRIEFGGAADASGRPVIIRRTHLPGLPPLGGERESVFLLHAATCRAELRTIPRWETPAEPRRVEVDGEWRTAPGSTRDPFEPGTLVRLVPRAARAAGPRTVEIDYEADGEPGAFAGTVARGLWTLNPGCMDARFELFVQPGSDGYWSAGFCAFHPLPREDAEFVQLPPLFQFQRLPPRPEMVTSTLTPHPMALVQTRPGGSNAPPVCLVVSAEPDRLPFRWPSASNMVYGFSLLNARGLVQPCAFSPVMGTEASRWAAGSTQSIAWRVLACPGDWTAAMEHYVDRIAGVRDYRRPVCASLTDAALNMMDLMLDGDAGGWTADMKGFYDIETPAMGKQAAPLAVIAASLVARDERAWRERALPTIEFTLRSRGSAVVRTAHDARHDVPLPNQLAVPSAFYDTAYWEGVHALTGGLNPWLAGIAAPGGTATHSRAYNTSRRWVSDLALHRLRPDPALLEQAKRGADEFVRAEIFGRQTKPVSFEMFYNIHFYPAWWELPDLYEATGDRRYLDAAAEGAFHTIAGLWSHPRVPEGDTVIHRGGQEPTYHRVWWRDGGTYRLGWPRQPGDTPERTVPAWQVSAVGLGLEQPSTYTAFPPAMNQIMMSVWSPNLLRVHLHTGRDVFRTAARNSIIGRFANYPGYYLTTFTDLVHRPRYPYEGPDLTCFYYHHLPVQFGFTLDYLVTQARVGSGDRVRFPWSRQRNYAWFDFRVPTPGPGGVYGETGAVLWLDRRIARPDTPQADWLAARSRDRFFLMLVSQSDAPLAVRPNLDAAFAGLRDGVVRVYEGTNAAPATLRAVPDSVTIPPRGMVTLSIPAESREGPVRGTPLARGHFTAPLDAWGTLHAFRIRSPFGNDSVFVTLPVDAVPGAVATLKRGGGAASTVLRDDAFPYEFSLGPVAAGEVVDLEFAIEAGAVKPAATATLSIPGG
jgi:hypothetical protein